MLKDTPETIEAMVRAAFADAIVRVHVRPREDFYTGDPVLDVTVVHDKRGLLDADRALQLITETAWTLGDKGEPARPIFTFMTKSEAASFRPEAA